MKSGALVQAMAWWMGMGVLAAAPGCERPKPPPAPTPIEPAPEVPVPEALPEPPPEPEATDSEPEAPTAAEPEIPDAPASGRLDDAPFALAQATVEHSVLSLTDTNGRTIAIVLFSRKDELPGTIDLTSGEIPFGSPHVVVRTGEDQPARNYTGGYRLLLELDGGAGGIWLELPEDRGTVAGRFDLP